MFLTLAAVVSLSVAEAHNEHARPKHLIYELVNPCLNQSSGQASLPWCDYTLPIDDRVDDMISRMSLDEKISTMNTDNAPINSLGLHNPYDW